MEAHPETITREFAQFAQSDAENLHVVPTCASERPLPHAPHGEFGEKYSEYSDCWWKLDRPEWCYLTVTTAVNSLSDWVLETLPGQATMFHGTTYGAAYMIINVGRGFVPGEGTHVKNGRSCAGAWCVPSFGDGLLRSDPSRWRESDGSMNRLCTPVVLEIRCAALTKIERPDPDALQRVDPGSQTHGSSG